MKNILRVLLLAPILLSAGCCANDVCNCDDLFADSLFFLFKTSGTNAFTGADVDTVYLLRYASGASARPTDSTAVIRSQYLNQPQYVRTRIIKENLDVGTLILSNSYPFTAGSTGKLSQYSYQLRVRLGDSRRNRTYVYNVNTIRLNGRYSADGCCTCYQNETKSAFIRDKYTDFTETAGQPVVATLEKY